MHTTMSIFTLKMHVMWFEIGMGFGSWELQHAVLFFSAEWRIYYHIMWGQL